jgi:hypothetical protein
MTVNGAHLYPQRPRFFAMKFLRLLTKTAAAQTIGADACWLLTIIATLEDVTHYRRGVTFYNEQLQALVGVKRWHTFDTIRQRAIDAGWLHYQAPPSGVRGKPGVYWVIIPDDADGLSDSFLDEGQPSTLSVDAQGSPSSESVDARVDARVYGGVDARVELPYPTPTPNSNTSSCPAAAAADEPDWKDIRKPGLLSNPKRIAFTDEDKLLADWFWQTVVALQPDRKPPKIEDWANTIRLMRTRDNRTHDQVRDLFERVQRNDFWRVNILSPSKLREKWDDLKLRLQGNANGTGQPNGRRASVDRAGAGAIHNPAVKVGAGF